MDNKQKETEITTQKLTPPASDQATVTVNKKTSPWVWVISGCLVIIILTMGMIGFLGWWGYQKAKKEIEKQRPGIEQFKDNLEKAGKEAEELNKKAQEIQNAIPNPDDSIYPTPAPEEEPVLN